MLKILIGFILVFTYHIPKLIIQLLLISYAAVFNYKENLTADPRVHLKRAKRLLRKNNNSLLLYAALEIRFAAERLIDSQTLCVPELSKRTLKKNDRIKKRVSISQAIPESDFEHDIFYTGKDADVKIPWSSYKPLEVDKIKNIIGRLGDILHPKPGLMLGISNDIWYIETRKFLNDSCDYFIDNMKNNDYYTFFGNVPNFEIEKRKNGS